MALSPLRRTVIRAFTINSLRKHARSRRPGHTFSRLVLNELKKSEANDETKPGLFGEPG